MISLPVLISLSISTVVLIAFYLMSMKEKTEASSLSTFECGYASYFYSRFSFSIQYFNVALIFLFLDLELCVIFPVFTSMGHSGLMALCTSLLIGVLLSGLATEWLMGKLDWIR